MIRKDEIKDKKGMNKAYLEYTISIINNTKHWYKSEDFNYLIFKKSFNKNKFVRRIRKYIKLNSNTISKHKIDQIVETVNENVKYAIEKDSEEYKQILLNKKLKKIKNI